MEHDHGWFFTGCSSEKDLLSTGARTLMSCALGGSAVRSLVMLVVLAEPVDEIAAQHLGRQDSGDPQGPSESSSSLGACQTIGSRMQ